MNNCNCCFTFIVTMSCFLGSITIFTMSFYYPESIFFYLINKNKYSYNKNISSYIDYQFFPKNNISNISVLNYKNNSSIENFHNSLFLNKIENELNIPKGENEIRQLEPNILNYFNLAILINFLSFYLCFYLFISFFIEKNECEDVGCWHLL